MLVRLPNEASQWIGAASLERVYLAQDAFGYPALGFELRATRAADFERETAAHLGQRLCIVLEGKVRSAPTLNAKLSGGGVIEGRFRAEEVAHEVDSLTRLDGPLRLVEVR